MIMMFLSLAFFLSLSTDDGSSFSFPFFTKETEFLGVGASAPKAEFPVLVQLCSIVISKKRILFEFL